jgi:NAD(P)-dependent dehydrogenase (short-subunit alcohol dehydrogenase family)
MSNILSLFDLSGRTAIVTGGAGLLGAEFCKTLVEAGANVVVADIDLKAAQAVADSLAAVDGPRSTVAVHVDVTQPASVQAMVAAALQAFGRLDILVNSAALDPKFDPDSLAASTAMTTAETVGLNGAFESYPLQAWQQALDVNLTGAFLCCQAAAAPMLAHGKGTIINLSSIYGLAGPDQRMYQHPDRPPQFKPVYYSVTKWGILGLTQYLATYYAGKNIRVNAISPGGVFNGHDETFLKAYSARAVLGRMAEKDEMNGALLYLASDASAYVTGSNLVVDGGWTVW